MRLGALWPYLDKMGLQVKVSMREGNIIVTHTFPEYQMPDDSTLAASLRGKVQELYAEMDIHGTPQIGVANAFNQNSGTTVTMIFARDCKEHQIQSIADSLATDYAHPHIIDITPNLAGGRVVAPAPRTQKPSGERPH